MTKNIFFYLQLLFALLNNTSCINDNTLNLIKQGGVITKVEISINKEKNKKKIVIKDVDQLEKINQALQTARVVIVQKGGAFDLLSDMTIYKNHQKVYLYVVHSTYHGWYIETDNSTLSSDYIFGLITNYNK